jgi:hypothetical protein
MIFVRKILIQKVGAGAVRETVAQRWQLSGQQHKPPEVIIIMGIGTHVAGSEHRQSAKSDHRYRKGYMHRYMGGRIKDWADSQTGHLKKRDYEEKSSGTFVDRAKPRE